MNRRDALLTSGSMVLSASLGALACGGPTAVAQNTPKPPPSPPPTGGHGDPSIFEAAHGCIEKGDACVAHCIMLLSSGDTSMAECIKASRDMHAVMIGLAAVAASGNPRLPAYAKMAMEFCRDCEAACRKHADHHVVCKECMDACGRTIAACQRVVG
ncbi:MAG TPA: Csp1 family four helix bundle copper storage protein [Labilithrix sp.]